MVMCQQGANRPSAWLQDVRCPGHFRTIICWHLVPYIALLVCNVCISTSFTYLFDISNSDSSAFLFVLQFYLFPYASNKPVEVLNTSSESWSLGKSLAGRQGISRQPRMEQHNMQYLLRKNVAICSNMIWICSIDRLYLVYYGVWTLNLVIIDKTIPRSYKGLCDVDVACVLQKEHI